MFLECYSWLRYEYYADYQKKLVYKTLCEWKYIIRDWRLQIVRFSSIVWYSKWYSIVNPFLILQFSQNNYWLLVAEGKFALWFNQLFHLQALIVGTSFVFYEDLHFDFVISIEIQLCHFSSNLRILHIPIVQLSGNPSKKS